MLAGALAALVALPASAAAAPLITDGPPAETGRSSAVVHATIDPNGADTTWLVEYGLTTGYGGTSVEDLVLDTDGPTEVAPRLTGLAPGATYHYRFVADPSTSPVFGPDRTLTTKADDAPGVLGQALAGDPGLVAGATFEARPPLSAAVPSAAITDPLGGFPLDPPSAVLLTTGSADLAGVPEQARLADTSLGGAGGRGDTAYDITTLRVDLDVPTGRSCLSVDFSFLSEEFPEFVGQEYNDAFVAEIDRTTWTTSGSAITAPDNFAFDPNGRVVSVNGVGDTQVSPAQAAGTVYDAATPVLRASVPITPGPHALYLSVFDQGDSALDSAVLLDRLITTSDTGAACASGAVDASRPRPPSGGLGTAAPIGGGVVASGAAGGTPQPVLRRQAVGARVSGTVLVTPPRGKRFTLGAADAIPLGSLVDARRGHLRLTAADGNGGTMGGEFWGGVFKVTQSSEVPVRTVLALAQDVGLRGCPAGSARSAKKRRKPGSRFLWGDGKGRFRTTGKNAAATVRGTRWLLRDSCAGTLVKVARGTVDVRDLVRRRTVPVKAGSSYLARPRRG